MGVMEAVKKGFSLTAKSLNLLVVIFIFNVVWNIVGIFLAPAAPVTGTGGPAPVNPAFLILSIAFIFLSVFIQGGILGSVRDLVKQGALKMSEFAKYGSKYYLKLFGLGLLIMAVVMVFALVAALLIAMAAPTGNRVAIGIVSILALIVGGFGIYVMILLFLSPYVLIADEAGVIESMKKSVQMVRKAIGKVLGLAVLVTLIAFGFGFVLGILTGLLNLALAGGTIAQIIAAVLTSALNAYIGVLMTASFMAMYLSLKQKA